MFDLSVSEVGMTYHVRVSWPGGKTNTTNFGDDLEAAARYADRAPDSAHGQTRTLVSVCCSCGGEINV